MDWPELLGEVAEILNSKRVTARVYVGGAGCRGCRDGFPLCRHGVGPAGTTRHDPPSEAGPSGGIRRPDVAVLAHPLWAVVGAVGQAAGRLAEQRGATDDE